MVDGILVVRFALIGPLVCHIWPELVELFDAQMKVLLGVKNARRQPAISSGVWRIGWALAAAAVWGGLTGARLRGIANYTVDSMAIAICIESKSFKFEGDSEVFVLISDASCVRWCLRAKLLWGEHLKCAR